MGPTASLSRTPGSSFSRALLSSGCASCSGCSYQGEGAQNTTKKRLPNRNQNIQATTRFKHARLFRKHSRLISLGAVVLACISVLEVARDLKPTSFLRHNFEIVHQKQRRLKPLFHPPPPLASLDWDKQRAFKRRRF